MQQAVQRVQRHRADRDEHAAQICRGEQLFSGKIAPRDHIGRHRGGEQGKRHRQQSQHDAVDGIFSKIQLTERVDVVFKLPLLRKNAAAERELRVCFERAEQGIDYGIQRKNAHEPNEDPLQDAADQRDYRVPALAGAHVAPAQPMSFFHMASLLIRLSPCPAGCR